MDLADTTWDKVEALCGETSACGSAASVQEAAQRFVELFIRTYESIVLARMFALLPLERLPEADRDKVRRAHAGDARLGDATRILSLLGTSGREKPWNDRLRSRGHLGVPLLDRAFVEGAPMIAKLLTDLGVDLGAIDDMAAGRRPPPADGRLPIASRKMLGGNNGTFYVADAQSAVDARGRRVIGAVDFVRKYAIRTVFGMGGAYLDGTIVVAIFFTAELVDRLVVERLPSLISNFKMATSKLEGEGRIFPRA